MFDEHLQIVISASDTCLDVGDAFPLGSLWENFGEIMKKIQDELKLSDFMARFEKDFRNVFDEWDLQNNAVTSQDSSPTGLPKDPLPDIDIVCYGLGQFSCCYVSRYQLGFLLLLKHILHSVHVYVYDPLFNDGENRFLKELGLDVLYIDEEAKRKMSRKTVCFMPWCPTELYNNLLWANWNVERLSELVIIGNSFFTSQDEEKKTFPFKYINLARKFVTEIRMQNVFRFPSIFEDLSVYYFKSSSLFLVDSLVWTDLKEPPMERLNWIRRHSI